MSGPPRRGSKTAGVRPNQVRIIGGQWRGRRLRFPVRDSLRPTPDRVRETLFNWLGQDLRGQSTLDVFAGTGVLSLEALSRGAVLAVALERDRDAVAAIRTSAELVGARGLELHCADGYGFLARDERAFDVVFLDPPFDEAQWERLLPLAEARVRAEGFIYAEASSALGATATLEIARYDKAGQVHYHLLRRVA